MRTVVVNLVGCLLVLTSPISGTSLFTGIWEASINDLPAVELTITEHEGKVAGSIVFYFQRRTQNGTWKVEGGRNPLPLLALTVKGNSLSFEVTHHKRHGGDELGPNVKFRMELKGPGTAALFKTEEASDGGPGLRLVRRKQTPGPREAGGHSLPKD